MRGRSYGSINKPARPNTSFTILTPTSKSPISDDVCGKSWDQDVMVRVPYKGLNQNYTTLPAINVDRGGIVADLEKALPFVMAPQWNAQIAKAIADAKYILTENNKIHIGDATNTNAINAIIDRADKYRKTAVGLIDYWKHWHTSSKEIGLWPLDRLWPVNCGNKINGEKISYDSGLKVHNITCPTGVDAAIRAMDRKRVRDLMVAALYNARCAQEGAAAVGVYYKNKKLFYGRQAVSGPNTLLYNPQKRTTSPTIEASISASRFNQGGPSLGEDAPSFEEGLSLDEGAPNLGEELTPEETVPTETVPAETAPVTAPPKKKDNTLMIVGAAAVAGLLMMKGKS